MHNKKILFVIHALNAGGAQKALVSLLSSLPQDKFDVDLMVLNRFKGLFSDCVPEWINIIYPSEDYYSFYAPLLSRKFLLSASFKTFCYKIKKAMRIGYDKEIMSLRQYSWLASRKSISNFSKHYDVAISFMHAESNYYVVDKVFAEKKILWIHNDYSKMVDKPDFDLPYFSKAFKVATISDACVEVLKCYFPSIADKFICVENIISKAIIDNQKKKIIDDAYFDDNRFKILSVGRLENQKGYDLAIVAAKILSERKMDFAWYIIGDGSLLEELRQSVVKQHLEGRVFFLGVRSNPYPYIYKADIFAMPSRFEGKSIALDEAKVLCKPIVVTKYPTIGDAIDDGVSGILTEIDSHSIADGIYRLYIDEHLRNNLCENLSNIDSSNSVHVLNTFYQLVD